MMAYETRLLKVGRTSVCRVQSLDSVRGARRYAACSSFSVCVGGGVRFVGDLSDYAGMSRALLMPYELLG